MAGPFEAARGRRRRKHRCQAGAPPDQARSLNRIERQQSAISDRHFNRGMLTWADVAQTGSADALAALDLPMRDFEDALQVAAAMACGAKCIVTRNERDFKASPVPALSPDAFLRRYPAPPA